MRPIKVVSKLIFMGTVLSMPWAHADLNSPLETFLGQSSVKSQGVVKACSIFSTTGLLEYKLKKLGLSGDNINLSEQWLIYLTAGQKGEFGVRSTENIKAYNQHGFVTEKLWPLRTSVSWENVSQINPLDALLKPGLFKRCGHLNKSDLLPFCLIGQRDPRLLNATDEELLTRNSGLFDREFYGIKSFASETKAQYRVGGLKHTSKKNILQLLDQGEALLLDINMHYQAWNHSRGKEKGLSIDRDLFHKGIITYPHPQSKDYNTRPSGHSVIIVGYDKDLVLERTIEDTKGNPLKVQTKGVYYVKNSWGTNGFGKDFSINGQRFPGFGMIAMDYADKMGEFIQLTINGK